MLKEAAAEKAKLVPKTGYNVVGVDDFEPFGEKLYLISHHATEPEAKAAKAAFEKRSPGDACYVYGPDTK